MTESHLHFLATHLQHQHACSYGPHSIETLFKFFFLYCYVCENLTQIVIACYCGRISLRQLSYCRMWL